MTEAKSRVAEVEAVGPIISPRGNREAGDRFDYDVGTDPDQLVALGLIKERKAAKASPKAPVAPKAATKAPSRPKAPTAPASKAADAKAEPTS